MRLNGSHFEPGDAASRLQEIHERQKAYRQPARVVPVDSDDMTAKEKS